MTPDIQNPTPSLRLPSEDARAVLWVRALEECDEEGLLLPDRERLLATRQARLEPNQASADERLVGPFLVRRARRLIEVAQSQAGPPGVGTPQPLGGPPTRLDQSLPPIWWLWVPCVLLGALSAGFGPSRQVNVLANPLFALVLWNLGFLALRSVWSLRGRQPLRIGAPQLPGPLARLADRWNRRALHDDSERARVLQRASLRFGVHTRGPASPWMLAKAELILHACAAAWVTGALLGLYQRGLVRRFHAVWESTFLDAAQADGLLDVLLAPGHLLGLPLPSVGELDPTAQALAAPWIHAWALTCLVVCWIPRALLAWRAHARARQFAAQFELDLSTSYFRDLLRPVRGGHVSVQWLPYSYSPPARRTDALRSLLHDVFGARAQVERHEPLEYGAEWEDLELHTDTQGQVHYLVLFSLAQSPEVEVHADFVASLRAQLSPEHSLLIAIDAAPYAERLHDLPEAEQRIQERTRAWDRVLREVQQSAQHVDFDGAVSDRTIQAMTQAVSAEPS